VPDSKPNVSGAQLWNFHEHLVRTEAVAVLGETGLLKAGPQFTASLARFRSSLESTDSASDCDTTNAWRYQLETSFRELSRTFKSIMAHVVVRVGDNIVESVITRTSAEELDLRKGDSVKAVVKSTEVMIQKG
jgi:molybdopterin-binding protein